MRENGPGMILIVDAGRQASGLRGFAAEAFLFCIGERQAEHFNLLVTASSEQTFTLIYLDVVLISGSLV